MLFVLCLGFDVHNVNLFAWSLLWKWAHCTRLYCEHYFLICFGRKLNYIVFLKKKKEEEEEEEEKEEKKKRKKKKKVKHNWNLLSSSWKDLENDTGFQF